MKGNCARLLQSRFWLICYQILIGNERKLGSGASKQILVDLLSNSNKKCKEIELGCLKAALGPSQAASLVSQNHRFWLTSLPRPLKFLIFKECTTLFMFFYVFGRMSLAKSLLLQQKCECIKQIIKRHPKIYKKNKNITKKH